MTEPVSVAPSASRARTSCCGECGRPKIDRLFATGLTGCPECDEILTRHCCMGWPPAAGAPEGTPWRCPECGSLWRAQRVAEPCGHCCDECGHEVTVPRWDIVEDRRVTGPRREPRGWWSALMTAD